MWVKTNFLLQTKILALSDLEKELLSLPVRQCDTLKYKQRKMDIEVKLNELDEAIKELF